MGLNKSFLFGFLACALMVGCAGFTIKYYALEGVVYEHGILKGPEPKYNKDFSDCAPDAVYKGGKCVVMFFDEFQTLKTDYKDCKMRLNECERYRNQQP